jgi:Cu+-exporting ATPase
LRSLLNIGAKEATLWRDGVETLIPIGALGVGEIFMVRPGETIATDGVVVEGQSAVDRSMVTGESIPIEISVGDTVTGGTLNYLHAVNFNILRIKKGMAGLAFSN